MAVMDYRRAQALAEELIKTGQSKGLSREALVQQIVAESGGAGAPGTAIGVVAPQPREVTPATPAPVQQGVPLVAPKPVAPPPAPEQAAPESQAPQRPAPQSSYRQALGSTQQQIAEVQTALAAMPPGQDNILDRTRLQTRLQMLTDRAGMLEGEALATENAQIPEEVRAALENREARLARREERIEESRARSPFEALIAGGAAMAQGRRGENFAEALARGLQTGVQQYGRSRQEREEGIEGVGEARDEIVIKRYDALKQAQNEARNIIRSGRDYDEKTLAIANATEGLIQKTALGESTLDTAVAQAKEAGIKADSAQAIINSEIEKNKAYVRAQDRPADSDKVDVEKRMAGQALQALADDYDAAAAVYNDALRQNGMMDSMVPAEVKSAYIAAQAKLKSRSSSYARTYGSSPFIQNERPRAAARQTATGAPSGVINLGKIGQPGR